MDSLWKTITKTKNTYPILEKDLKVDVVIVGGGITGITAAKQLIDAGKIVAVLESYEIGGVTTGSSTGNLYVPVQPLYQSIEKKFNLETAKTVAHSRKLAIDYIESTVNEYNISCHFKTRPWYAYTNDSNNATLTKEMELFKRMELEVAYTDDLPLNFLFKKAIVMPNQARFNPLAYVSNLAHELYKKGCHLFEHTRALKIEEDSHCTVVTEFGKITAKQVIIATHTPIGRNITQIYTAPYRSYVVAVTLKENHYPEGHFWDMEKHSHATCTHALHNVHPEILMVAGSHHKTGQESNTSSHFKDLVHFLKKQFNIEDVIYQWSAQHYHAADSVPYIGLAHAAAKYTYMATGYFADGLVYGTLAGIILGDLIAGKENDFFQIYNAQRKNLWHASPFLFKEGSNLFLQYLQDLPLFNKTQYKDLKKGEGKIVERNREKYAVSKDNNDKLHIVSAVCPHMKGIVSWNNAEKTWDCPIHGSRFTCEGEIIEGPTMCPLLSRNLD